MEPIAAPYLPFFRSSDTLDTALLYGPDNDCVERYFFYDDQDGIDSFESFRETYRRDPAWEIVDHGAYVHLTGRGPGGRRIEIFANVPIDGHLPENRAREGEAQRRQQAIAAALEQRGLTPSVIVHRGHSFWVRKTLSYVTKPARLVILGSCGGATEIYRVIDAAHDAQVIATRGVGETEINDAILKAVNDRIRHRLPRHRMDRLLGGTKSPLGTQRPLPRVRGPQSGPRRRLPPRLPPLPGCPLG